MSQNVGYWGRITSNYDWCEHNYEFTYYIAEFFNTLSSVPIIVAGLYGLINCIRYEYAFKFCINNLLLMLVGIGSVAFHGTLLRNGQILDEVPMLWCSLSMLYATATFSYQSNILLLITIIYGIVSTLIYFYVDFSVFIIAYIITIASIIGVQLLHKKTILSNINLTKYALLSAAFYGGGFLFLWLPEQIICGNRLMVQHESILTRLQFHAIFHITSSIGPYYFMIYAVMMHYHVSGSKYNPQIVYHTRINIPVVHIDTISTKQA